MNIGFGYLSIESTMDLHLISENFNIFEVKDLVFNVKDLEEF